MDGILEVFGSINWIVVAQLSAVGAITIAGPIVIFILAFRGGDL